MSGLCCSFTGHRAAKLPWRYNEQDPRCVDLKMRIYDTAEALRSSGYTAFICGMADGCDLYFCDAILRLKALYPEITLEAAIPFAGQADMWSEHEKQHYETLLYRCDKKTLLQQNYSSGCMMKRNRYMVDNSDLLIACFDGQSGGTLNTMRYALAQGKEIIHLAIE